MALQLSRAVASMVSQSGSLIIGLVKLFGCLLTLYTRTLPDVIRASSRLWGDATDPTTPERRTIRTGWQEGNTASEENRNDGHLHAVYQAYFQQVPKQLAPTEERDVILPP